MTDYRTLDPKSMRSMRIGYLLMTVIFAIAAVVLFFLRNLHESIIYVCMGVAAIAIVAGIITVVFPRIYYDHYRYFISEDRVDVRRGIIFLTHTVVPLERIHQVEVVSGPINRMDGLADVSITSAGGVAKIEYLETGEAERIADELNAIVDAIVKGQRNE